MSRLSPRRHIGMSGVKTVLARTDWRSALTALGLVFSIGYVLSFLLADQITQRAQDQAQTDVEETLVPRLVSFLDASDLEVPLSGPRLTEFERFLDSSLRRQDTLAIKLWNAAGVVVFADDSATVGAVAEAHEIEEMVDALMGDASSDIERSVDAQQRYGATTLEVYAPISLGLDGGVDGVLEIY